MAAFPTGDVYFQVKVNLVSAIGIPAIRGEVPDVYFDINWDNFKYFKTDVERKNINPVWKKVKEFYYETKFADQLDKKIVTFTCMQNQMMGDNLEIGIVDIDLMSIAAGCVLHDLPILTKHHRQKPGEPPTFVPTGARLRVEIEMNQLANMTIMLEDLKLHSFRVSKSLRLAFKYGRELENQRSSFKTSKPSDLRADELRWPPTPINFYTSLVDLENEFFHVMTVEGTAGSKTHLDSINIKIPFTRILQTHGVQPKPVDFKEAVIENGKTQCTFSCRMTLSDVPRFCQLVGGIHSEHGITGKPRYEGFVLPKHFIPESALSPKISRDKSPSPAVGRKPTKEKPSELSAGAATPVEPGRKSKRSSAQPSLQNTPSGSPQLSRPASSGPFDAHQMAQQQQAQQMQLQQLQIQPQQPIQPVQAPIPQRAGTASPAPITSAPYSQSPSAMPPLPAGWEAAVDPNGKTYYIDHNSKTTSWFHPATPTRARRLSNPQSIQQQPVNPQQVQQQQQYQQQPQQQQVYPHQNPQQTQQYSPQMMPQQPQNQVGYASGNPFAVQGGYGTPQNGYGPVQNHQVQYAQPMQQNGYAMPLQQGQSQGGYVPVPTVQQPALHNSQPAKKKADPVQQVQHSSSTPATGLSPKPARSDKTEKILKAPTSTASGAGIVGSVAKTTVDSPSKKRKS